MPQRNLLILLAATAVSYVCYAQGQQGPYGRYLVGGLAAIDRGALDPAPKNELFAGAMDGMVRVLRQRGDQHSQFFDEAAARRLRSEIHQQVGGIGVRVRVAGQPPLATILGPILSDSPAGRADLRPGDQIRKIDGQPIRGFGREAVLDRLNGAPGTAVQLSIHRPSEQRERDVDIIRDLIPTEAVLGDRRDENGQWQFALETDPRIAHVRITAFGDRTAEQFAATMRNITAGGAEAIVLDMRDNAGGSLGSAVGVSEMLLPANSKIVATYGRNGELLQTYATDKDGAQCNLRLAVVVNQNSASAAEIVAACLQDHGRATVVGQRSFGKGTVQQMLPMGKGVLKLTWAGFRRPNGGVIHRAANAPESEPWGVTPDAGCDCVQSPKRWSAYRDYRSRRDEADGTANESAGDFVDEPLQMAVRRLQRQLDDEP